MKQRQRGTTIYALCDPATGEIRYVGKTVFSETKRLRQHVSDSTRRESHCSRWIRYVGTPLIKALCVVPDSFAAEMETRAIARFRALGYRLTNLTDGGEGNVGWIPSAATRERIRAAHLGRKLSEETRERMRAAHRERAPTPREKLASCGFRGRVHTPEAKAKLSAARRSHVTTDASREANRAGQIGRRHTPATIAKMCASQRGHECSEATRAKIAAAAIGRKLQFKRVRTKPFTADERANISAASRASWARRKAM